MWAYVYLSFLFFCDLLNRFFSFSPYRALVAVVPAAADCYLGSFIFCGVFVCMQTQIRNKSKQVLWSKGVDILLALLEHAQQDANGTFPIDMYGSGADLEEVTRSVRQPAAFHIASGFSTGQTFSQSDRCLALFVRGLRSGLCLFVQPCLSLMSLMRTLVGKTP